MSELLNQCCNFLLSISTRPKNDSTVVDTSSYDIFNSPQHSSFPEIIKKLNKQLCCSESSNILAICLIEKLLQKHNDFTLSENNLNRVFTSAMIIAVQMNEDDFELSASFAVSLGMSYHSLAQLVMKFFDLIEQNAYVSNEDYLRMCRIVSNVRNHSSRKHSFDLSEFNQIIISGDSILL